jgi:RNA polymerase sigma-70 factor (ECF subfamily)
VAANLARDEARPAIRRRAHLQLVESEVRREQDDQTGAEERMVQAEASALVRRALEAVSEKDRHVLLLWSGGLSYRDIAEETGLSPGAIGTTLARARRRLAEAFEQPERDHAARG